MGNKMNKKKKSLGAIRKRNRELLKICLEKRRSNALQAAKVSQTANAEAVQDAEMPQTTEMPNYAESSQGVKVEVSESESTKAETPQNSQVVQVTWTTGTNQEQTPSEDATTHSLLIELEPMKPSTQSNKELRNHLKYCVVPTCLKNQITNPDLTFFSFPNDTRYRKYWCKRIDREDLWLLPPTQVSKYHVCNLHFEEKQIFIFNSKPVLLSCAIPRLELPVGVMDRTPLKKTPKKKGPETIECSVLKCQHNTKDNRGLQFFLIPRKKKIVTVWNNNMGLTNYRKSYMICERHFEKRYIKVNRQGVSFLSPDAVPTLHLPIPYDRIIKRLPKCKYVKKRKTVSTQTDDTTVAVASLEFVDLSKNSCEVNKAKSSKDVTIEESNRREDVAVKTEQVEDEDYTVVISTNPLDPNVVDALHDSLVEAQIKKEPVEIVDEVLDLASTSAQKAITTTQCAANSNNTTATAFDLSTTSLSFSKEKIKALYETGTEDMKLLFYYCDRYCSKRTNGSLQLEKEIFPKF